MIPSTPISVLLTIFSAVSALPQATSITATDLATHSSASDCWVVNNGQAYDVTSFVSKHKGGDVFSTYCGKADGGFTAMFASAPHGHSDAFIAKHTTLMGAVSGSTTTSGSGSGATTAASPKKGSGAKTAKPHKSSKDKHKGGHGGGEHGGKSKGGEHDD